MSAYSGVLISTLSMYVQVNPINSVKDLHNHPEIKAVMEKGAIEEYMLRISPIQEERDLINQLDKTGRLVTFDKLISDTVLDDVEAGKAAILSDNIRIYNILSTRYAEKKFCNYHITKAFLSFAYCLALRKDTPVVFMESLNERIAGFTEAFLFKQGIYRQISNFTRCFEQQRSGFLPINLSDLSSIFLLFFYGNVVAGVFLIFECILFMTHHRSK
ncbi:uncharacterized protein LOC143246137 [Tachypleus tridentatus]|uniref:uncharacterized protein LOC143246137 n=1 Tax=Tachypleus tridentatus TaxID=6853 RepID=UPI003FD33613